MPFVSLKESRNNLGGGEGKRGILINNFIFSFLFRKKMDVEIRRQRIQDELKTCRGGLTRSDRRLISTFLGYLPIVGIREKKKDWQVSPIYVRSNIFPFLMEEKERNESEKLSEKSEEIEWETKPFEMSEINFQEDKYFPSIFRRDKDSMTKFLAEEGIGLNSIEECSLVRTFQVSEKKNPVTDGLGRSRTVTDGHGRLGRSSSAKTARK